MRPPRDANTRERIVFFLKMRGPQSAADLAARLHLTSMAVRQHLHKLQDQGDVTYEDEAGKVGRPTRLWSLTEAGARGFQDGHAQLSATLIGAARRVYGEEGLRALIEQRKRQQLSAYRKRMPAAAASLRDRVAALAALRREEGYMAEWKQGAQEGFLLIENHCPICDAVASCGQLCDGELELFRALLGRRVRIEREEYLLNGDRRCTYRITERTRRTR